ncbi:helix-turn-helix domain-containing protein [Seinonella peptonophila]|uniref:TetR/AcrR family transcriptional regulator n=1 Tax=Seinonella peptonophila TaxID=112248 RepID=UPI000A0355F2
MFHPTIQTVGFQLTDFCKNDIEDRRFAILEAAYSLFGQQSYANTSIKQIAQEAGVGHGLILHQ